MVIDYTFDSKKESISQYNERIAAERAAAGGSSAATNSGTNDFLSTLKEKLLGQAGAISSEDTNIEKKIQDAIGAVNTGKDASKQYIESTFGRQIEEAKTLGEKEVTSFAEAGRGFAVNTAATRAISDNAEKRVKDLEQRKQELILMGDSQAAGQISGLIMKELEFEQQARIQNFSNMLNIGNFALKALETQTAIADAGALKASDVETFTDANGNVTAKNKITGKTIWSARVGRAGSASPNISVNPIADPTTGTVQYTEVRDRDTGKVTYFDNAGNEVDPSKVQIGKPADPLDTIINDILNDIGSELVK